MTALCRTLAFAREQKFLPAPPFAATDDGVFEGYASLFGLADLGRDVVAPGAFADSLARRGASGVRMLWQHDPAQPIGRWLTLAEDARGLRVRGQLNLAVARARELHALLRDGAVDGLSIGFRVERARPDRRAGLRRLERVDLWEISLVTFPMLPGARVSGVKRARPAALQTSPVGRGRVRGSAPGEGRALTGQGAAILAQPYADKTRPSPGRLPPTRPLPTGEVRGAPLAAVIRHAAARLFHL